MNECKNVQLFIRFRDLVIFVILDRSHRMHLLFSRTALLHHTIYLRCARIAWLRHTMYLYLRCPRIAWLRHTMYLHGFKIPHFVLQNRMTTAYNLAALFQSRLTPWSFVSSQYSALKNRFAKQQRSTIFFRTECRMESPSTVSRRKIRIPFLYSFAHVISRPKCIFL